jgi:hypothetical protein
VIDANGRKIAARRPEQTLWSLCGPLHGDDGQMPSPREIAELEREAGSWLATNECLGRGAGRTSGPARARLEAGCPAGGSATVIDLVRRSCGEPGVRPVAVVPGHEEL